MRKEFQAGPVKMDDAGGGARGLRARLTEELTDAVRSAYGIACDTPPVDLGGSSNLNLLVSDREDLWVVRVYRPYVTKPRLRAIHMVRHELEATGVPCGGLLPTRNGDDWIVHQGRLVEVERFVERDADMDSWGALDAGMAVLAPIHDSLRHVPVGEEGRRPLFANYIGHAEALDATVGGIDRIKNWGPSPSELELAAAAGKLARAVSDAEGNYADELPIQLVHGDFWDDNVFLRDGEVVYVTDFDFMGARPRIDDLALTLFFACMEFFEQPVSDDQLERVRSVVDAYDSCCEVPLSAMERAALPVATARQPLWSIGGWVRLLDDEEAARRHAGESYQEVLWALNLMKELDRWQTAVVG